MSLKIKGSSPRFFLLYTALFALLVYSRFVNIGWGLPYPFHPDERNIAASIMGLTCHGVTPGVEGGAATSWNFWKECLNPHFFAYGQLTIYLGYILAIVSRLFTQVTGPIQFNEAVIAIRIISAVCSILTVWVGLKIVKLVTESHLTYLATYLLLIFSPAAIQFAHYGTTESLLMLCYTLLIFLSIRYAKSEISMGTFAGACGAVIGLAAGAKISSLIFAFLPAVMFIFPRRKQEKEGKRDYKLYIKQLGERVLSVLLFGITVLAVALATSFYSVLDLKNAMSALDFESAVALGTIEVFYTRSFAYTMPIVFHFTSVFPFALGPVMMGLFMIGFFILPWKREYVVMRIAFLLYFVPSALTYTKWTRFMAPIFPLMILFGVFTLFRIYDMGVNFVKTHPKLKNGYKSASLMADSLFFSIMLAVLIVPGLAYLTIYQTPDVRYKASEWIFKNVEPDAYILQETANVVDIPVSSPQMPPPPPTNYQYFSFNFYDVDADPNYQPELRQHVGNADYIFVPSRRIFANHTCMRRDIESCRALRKKYPVLNEYYDSLFNGELGFKEVAVFTSYPRIELFGKTILEFPDEVAEETWTVFDHPVIRIYKRI